jgi:hypothetical protein
MKKQLIERLKKIEYYTVKGVDGGIEVKDERFGTKVIFTMEAFKGLDLDGAVKMVMVHSACGKNVEWITRVTGYFSKVNNWNKGKKAELEDRHKTKEFGG